MKEEYLFVSIAYCKDTHRPYSHKLLFIHDVDNIDTETLIRINKFFISGNGLIPIGWLLIGGQDEFDDLFGCESFIKLNWKDL